jgi:hypothetical protein
MSRRRDIFNQEITPTVQTWEARPEVGEKLIQAFLLIGFGAIVVLEGWLVWQVLSVVR